MSGAGLLRRGGNGVAMYGEPAEVRRMARQVGGWAEQTRADAGRAARAADVRWQSVAAQRFRQRVDDAVESVARAARELDDLQAALDAHAAEVERRLAQIETAERWLRARGDDVRDGALGAADWTKEQLRSAADAGFRAVSDVRFRGVL